MKSISIDQSPEKSKVSYNKGEKKITAILKVGSIYKIIIENPKSIRDNRHNGRIVKVVGFNDEFPGDVLIKYLDNNRRGKVKVDCLIPYDE